MHKLILSLIVGYLILAGATVYSFWQIHESRIQSCERTYEGTRQVFRPFFHAKSQRTHREQRNIDKFNRRIDHLKAGCEAQTS